MTKKSFKIKSGLAEALHDTVSSAQNNAGELHIEVIPLRKIELDPYNPRDLLVDFDDLYGQISGTDLERKRKKSEIESLQSMVNSIKDQGIINPIVVYKHGDFYRLIAGERRTLSAIIAKKEDIPAKILTSKPDPLKLSLLQWIENMERENLSLWEKIRNLEKILGAYTKTNNKSHTDVTATDISRILGCSLQHGVNYRNILSSTDELKKHIKEGNIKNIDKAAFIAKSATEIQPKLIEHCVNGHTLAEMKKIAANGLDSSISKIQRQMQPKINFGSTSNMKVAKLIIDSITKNDEIKTYTAPLNEIAWDNPKSIALAFKKLVKVLEKV